MAQGSLHAEILFREDIPAYDFPPEHANAIVRASAYHRKDYDLAVIWFPPSEHANIVTSISSTFREPTAGLGALDRLPRELIDEVCLRLDIASLFRFRQLNLRARQMVSSLHEFKTVTKHALTPLCAVLRTRTTPAITISEFYRLLCQPKCSLCQYSCGVYVQLLFWIRCCPRCFIRAQETSVRTAAKVESVLGLSKKSLDALPHLTTIPGIYSMDETRHSSPVTLVPYQSAVSAFRAENAGVEPELTMRSELRRPWDLQYLACCALPSYDPQTGQVQTGLSCAGCQLAVEKHLYAEGQERLVHVKRDMVYTRDGFLEHFKWCSNAQRLWESSSHGAVEPRMWSSHCRNGGFMKPRE